MRHLLIRAVMLGAAAATAPLTCRAAAARYIATDLGALNAGTSIAVAISSDGKAVTGVAPVVGKKLGYVERVFLWTPTRGLRQISLPGFPSGVGMGVNIASTVAGAAYPFPNSTIGSRAFVIGPRVGFTLLAGSGSVANGINDAGAAVGALTAADGEQDAFLWQPSTGLVDLGRFGGTSAVGQAINAAGDVLANVATPQSFAMPVLVHAGEVTHIDVPPNLEAEGEALNAGRQVVIQLYPPDSHAKSSRAYLWSKGSLERLLPVIASDPYVSPYGIDDAGDVVGAESSAEGALTPVIWPSGSTAGVDLNTLIDPASGITMSAAYAINNAGQIVGTASAPAKAHAVLLTPEP